MFYKKYLKIKEKNNSHVCVGLDSDYKKISNEEKDLYKRIYDFNKDIVEKTNKHVCCYKLNSAFYEKAGVEGMKAMEDTVNYIKENTEIPIILDVKRSDILNTAKAYADYFVDKLQADSVTLNPLMGRDSITPYLEKKVHVFILVLTSNPSASDFIMKNDLYIDLTNFSQVLNKEFENQVGIVVGATNDKFKEINKINENMIYLIPGIGAQGGDLKKVLEQVKDKEFVINSSRGVIFSEDPKKSVIELKNNINGGL
ncbi:orotidine-5'-phosphate decarboxylase [Geotoga petraea]|uniref:Orotidine-5'-phosphate decarboxylase n=1 Tax=Geotoga petraea TaxID=28234 RepID=A0A1G6PT59_9BACT|nr:orotidine-5'-phosphate decarboxylase [Geotoga petraea]SDC82555.1 orotidine-5'-phosphate decarboxylase [Geotoga petraea]